MAVEGAAQEVTIVGGRLLRVDLHEECPQDLVDVVRVLVVQLGPLVEHLEEVRLQVAALVQHHLGARLHLLYVLLLQPQPGLELADLALQLQPLLLALPLHAFALAVETKKLARQLLLQARIFLLEFEHP